MRKSVFLLIILAGVIIAVYVAGKGHTPIARTTPTATQGRSNMQLTSTAFANNESIPIKYTCQGEGISLPLSMKDVPDKTASLALIMDDPDAPSGDYVHWVVWNMPPTTTAIAENTIPDGVQEGFNGSGKTGYTGPCPPSGTHHYHFTLYALDKTLDLPAQTTKSDLVTAMQGHILDQAELIGIYQKQ